MNVTSFFPGRIRLRGEIFRDMEIASALRQAVEWHPAVQEIQLNQRTGSVLISYDENLLPMARIGALSAQLLELRALCLHYAPKKKPVILEMINRISRSFAES
ncbi:MAG: hypothetical protein IJX45_08100 [Spirochaetaceae bacterium]|nr:hypothetical protein [Spirochaetaceae bacterium]MBQ8385177.1 hypothetical protein [Spirochaetaceae bacterium]MBQ8562087.1 hypothetical protein [Spirochaetaceae bacterium]